MTHRPLIGRRQFLAAFGLAATGAAAVAWDAATAARGRVEVSRHDVPIPGLPAALAGLTIAQLSDVHFYAGMDRGAERAMEVVAELAPDVTVLTGDYVESTTQLGEFGQFVRACRGRLGTVVTMGNWEHQVGARPADMRRLSEAAGATFLLNETLVVRREEAALAIVGLDDPRAGRPIPDPALSEVPSGATAVWAFHAPGYVDLLKPERYPRPAFILAGHTHGGQIRIPLFPVMTPTGSGHYVEGWYRGGFAPMYVHRGIGTSGIRARLRCPPEVALFSLHAA